MIHKGNGESRNLLQVDFSEKLRRGSAAARSVSFYSLQINKNLKDSHSVLSPEKKEIMKLRESLENPFVSEVSREIETFKTDVKTLKETIKTDFESLK